MRTSLNEATKVTENILKVYHFFSSDHTFGDKKGGVGIYYKESLPLKIRHHMSFNECIVTELIFGRKKIFFTVLYRNPIHKVDSPEFENFLQGILISGGFQILGPWAIFYMRGPVCERREQLGSRGAVWGGGGELKNFRF